MSSYQKITVQKKKKKTLVVEVEEVHPDAPVFAELLDTEDGEGLCKVAAMLLFDEKGRGGEVMPVERDGEEISAFEYLPEDFISSVRIVRAEEIGPSSHDEWPMYKVVLESTLARKQDAELFEEGDTLSAVASLNGDFEDMFR